MSTGPHPDAAEPPGDDVAAEAATPEPAEDAGANAVAETVGVPGCVVNVRTGAPATTVSVP